VSVEGRGILVAWDDVVRSIALVLAVLLVACSAPTVTSPRRGEAPALWPLRGTGDGNGEALRRPVVVKVPNDPAARPQSGLANADLIWEIPVEGGITRYAVVFHSQEAANVGPVRSARLSDLQYVPLLRAILVHVGGSEPVLEKVRAAAARGEFVDVDEFTNAAAFERITTKQPPYNAYTSTAKAREAARANAKLDKPLPSFQFSTDAPKGGTATTTVSLPYATASQKVTYTWSASSWKRAQSGAPTKDAANGAEVSPTNVVIIKTDITEIPGTADVTGAPSLDFRSTGSGDVTILRDGMRIDGTWKRSGDELFRFADASGAAIGLRPGLTWIHIVPTDMQISGS
jgi:hypothetical protein